MTRKEPQFGDDLQQPIDIPALVVQTKHESSSTIPMMTKSPNYWLLWIFVIVSLFASFGMAFFGLEEAGKYQAALTKAQGQSADLQVTLERLNQTQVQDIGELAQSDAQMRKMVVTVERRMQSEFGDRLASLQSRVGQQSEALEAIQKAVQAVDRVTDETRNALISSDKKIATNSRLTREMENALAKRNKVMVENGQTIIDLTNRISLRDNVIDEALVLIREQMSGVRGRLDRLAEIRDAVVALSNNSKKLNTQTAATERSVKELEVTQAAIEQTVVSLEEMVALTESALTQLEQKHNTLANDTISSLAIENLKKDQFGLQNQLNEQNDLLLSVDSSRKSLNNRLIDLDARILALTPKKQ